jgi:predicted negative regulator of RcsB-dependent stress response
MTRSALLQLLAHPASLTEANVRELEQLAQAFPYCQTAHLLLAKAAHDQGSMLASQRLRRAATYAADRALLRQLIELPAPASPVLAEPAAAENDAVALAPAPASSAFAAPPAPIQDEPLAESTATEATLFEVEHTQLPAPASAAPALEPLPEALPDAPAASPDLAEVSPDAATTSASQPEAETAPEAEAAPEDELPAQAPPIRPPAEAEAASQEFGLAMAEPADIVAYQLPELLEAEEALASLPPTPVVASVLAALPAFAGAADVGYAPGEGSRLGFCLQSPLAEAYSLTTGPAALLPSAQLPPASEFFAPDALVLAHLEAHQPPVAQAPAPVAIDLINSFLQRGKQAGPRRRAAPPLPDAEEEEQPDLSGPSTRAVPDLASENLAKILARQGKPDRAIAIYERLMVKHPEKIAYFTAQIDSLRPQA